MYGLSCEESGVCGVVPVRVVSIKVTEPEYWSGGGSAGVGIHSEGTGSGKCLKFMDRVVMFTVVVDVTDCQFTPATTDGDDSYIS